MRKFTVYGELYRGEWCADVELEKNTKAKK